MVEIPQQSSNRLGVKDQPLDETPHADFDGIVQQESEHFCLKQLIMSRGPAVHLLPAAGLLSQPVQEA